VARAKVDDQDLIGNLEPEENIAGPDEQPKTLSVSVDLFANMLRIMQENANAQAKALMDGMREIADNLRRPPIDPVKEAQHARAQKAKENAEASYWKQAVGRSENCTHLREDMSSAIAWAEQSDTYADYPDLCERLKITGTNQMVRITRGTCQHCQTLFSPRREECVSDNIHQRYNEFRRIRTGRGQDSVMYIG
jgi:hypothetical protein